MRMGLDNWTSVYAVIVLCEMVGWQLKDRRDRNLNALLASPPLNLKHGQCVSTDKLFLPLYSFVLLLLAIVETAIAINLATHGDVVVPVFVLVLAVANMGFELAHMSVVSSLREAELLSALLGVSLHDVDTSSNRSPPGFFQARWQFMVTNDS